MTVNARIAGHVRLTKRTAQQWLDEIYTLVRTVRQPLWKIVTLFPGEAARPKAQNPSNIQ